MNKSDLINAVHAALGGTLVAATTAVDTVVNTLAAGIKSGDGVQLVGFGSFKTEQRAARNGRNPSTGEAIVIPAKVAIKFTVGKDLKEDVQRALGAPTKGGAKAKASKAK